MTKIYKDRIEAGILLSEKLLHYKNKEVVILAIPRGGLPLGAIVAKSLQAPLDIILTKKIGHPFNKEYAIGAVSMENSILNDSLQVSNQYIEEETKRIRAVLIQRYDQYYKTSKPQELTNKVVIIVDDGIATGNTILATIGLVHKQKPSTIIIAIPVAPLSAINKLKKSPHVHEIVCLQTPNDFRAVGQFYDDFYTVTDQEAIKILEESKNSYTKNIK